MQWTVLHVDSSACPPGSVRDLRVPAAFPQASADLRPEKGTDPGSPVKDSVMPTRHAKVRAEDRPDLRCTRLWGASWCPLWGPGSAMGSAGSRAAWDRPLRPCRPPGGRGCGQGTQRGTSPSRCWHGCWLGVSRGGVSWPLTTCSPWCWREPLPHARCPRAPSLRLPAQAQGLAVPMPSIPSGAVVEHARTLLPSGAGCVPAPSLSSPVPAPGWRRILRNQTWVLGVGTGARQTQPPPVGLEGGSHQRPGRCGITGVMGIAGLSAALPLGL